MEVVKQRSGDLLEVRVTGRLDNEWSVSFDEALKEILREGALHVRLDLTEVNYLSSAGIGVLMKAHERAGKLQGSFVIAAASDRVRSVLRMVKLEPLLFQAGAAPPPASVAQASVRHIDSESAAVECYDLRSSRSSYRMVGDPTKLLHGAYSPHDVKSIHASDRLFALGLGALGHGYDDCRGLFGEFVAIAGSAAFMPTNGSSTPDYMVKSGDLIPEVQAMYAVVFEGDPAHLLRFESNVPSGAVGLSDVVAAAAKASGCGEFGMVLAAESAGLVCAALRQSPDRADAARFEFPTLREWVSFAPEREHSRSSVLAAGIVSASPDDGLRSFLRPVGNGYSGHFHAAVAAFRSLPRGRIEIAEAIEQTFHPRSVVSVVHLLRDGRPIEGAGESLFHRGACWVFPLSRAGGES